MALIKPPTLPPLEIRASTPGSAPMTPDAAAPQEEMPAGQNAFLPPDAAAEPPEASRPASLADTLFQMEPALRPTDTADAEARIHREISAGRVANLDHITDLFFSPVFYEHARTFSRELETLLASRGRPADVPFYHIIGNERLFETILLSSKSHGLLATQLSRVLTADASPWMRSYALLLTGKTLARGEELSGASFDGRPFHSLLRRAVADADVLVAWNALRMLDQNAWADAAEMAELSDAFHPALPPRYLYGGDTARAARIQLLLSLPAAPLREERLDLTTVSPLPASADQDPTAADRTPVIERRYEELRAALASSGWDQERFFATYLDRGKTVLRFSNGKQYPAEGHRRLAALFKAARDGFIPTTWLEHVPFRVHALPHPLFEGKDWMTDELIQRALTPGAELTWDDVVPR